MSRLFMKLRVNRRAAIAMGAGGAASLLAPISKAAAWADIEAEAAGETVYFNAWAGSEAVNSYIAWAGEKTAERFAVRLSHVKITDAAEVVRRVRGEIAAGRRDGSVDLVWINGENFHAMKKGGLLYGPFAEILPNYRLVDVEGKPTTRVDFAEPVLGFEAPWGMAQLTFFGDGAKIIKPPESLRQLEAFAEANSGRFTYPAPPDFHGTTFLKQVLIENLTDRSPLQSPVTRDEFTKTSTPLWTALDRLHPHLWRQGKQFPVSQAQMKQMLADGELLIAFTFNPNEAANLIAANELPITTISWQHLAGTIGNTHFVAIPLNARAKAGAQVVANFLISPEAQARKADLKVWGDPTVLAMSRLSPDEARLFRTAYLPGALTVSAPALPEPHASWVPLLESAWLERYGA